MTNRQSPAIVLQVTAHAEADKIVTLYCRDLGKITTIAKGAKRSKKRFVNKLEPFTSLVVTCRPPKKGTLFFLSEAELVNAHLFLRRHYPGYVTATFISELVRRFSGDQDGDPAVFALLSWALAGLAERKNQGVIAVFFLLRLLTACGYRPQLTGCAVCGAAIDQQPAFALYPANGSLLCLRCRRQNRGSSLQLTRQTLKFLASGQQLPLSRLTRLHMSTANAYQALRALCSYSRHILQQDIHSWKQLQLLMQETEHPSQPAATIRRPE